MKPRRKIDLFSLSFMDCICCGFGAIILLFVLTIGPIKKQTHMSKRGVDQYKAGLSQMMDQLTEAIEATMNALGASLAATPTQSIDNNLLKDKILQLEEAIEARKQAISAANAALDSLQTQVIEAPVIQKRAPSTPVGVPTDSTHLIFLVDTSGSMRNIFGLMNELVLRQIERTLDAYPTIRGLQVMDTSGNYILPSTNKIWLPDTKQTRQRILSVLREYQIASASNPVPGLVKVFKHYDPKKNPDKKIAVYIFGDEFPHTASAVLRKLDKLNPIIPGTGKRGIAINATGFPFKLRKNPHPASTGYKYANLMRQLTYEHHGAFMVVRP